VPIVLPRNRTSLHRSSDQLVPSSSCRPLNVGVLRKQAHPRIVPRSTCLTGFRRRSSTTSPASTWKIECERPSSTGARRHVRTYAREEPSTGNTLYHSSPNSAGLSDDTLWKPIRPHMVTLSRLIGATLATHRCGQRVAQPRPFFFNSHTRSHQDSAGTKDPREVVADWVPSAISVPMDRPGADPNPRKPDRFRP